MGILDRFRLPPRTRGEQDVHLATVMEHGVAKLFLTFLSPEDIERQGMPAESIVGMLRASSTPGKSPFARGNFVVNRGFVSFLHEVIRRRGADDPSLIAEARGRNGGMALMLDRRRAGRADIVVEDLIGAFPVRDGKILAGSYQPNERYEVVSKDGFMTLDPWLKGIVLEELRILPPVS